MRSFDQFMRWHGVSVPKRAETCRIWGSRAGSVTNGTVARRAVRHGGTFGTLGGWGWTARADVPVCAEVAR